MILSFTGRTVAVLVSPMAGSPFVRPVHFTEFGVERDDVGVGLMQEDLAVA